MWQAPEIQVHHNIKHQKFKSATEHNLYLTMGQPGCTKNLLDNKAEYNIYAAHFIVGPELGPILSTQARTAFENQDLEELDRLLDSAVIKLGLERNSKWKRWRQNDGETK